MLDVVVLRAGLTDETDSSFGFCCCCEDRPLPKIDEVRFFREASLRCCGDSGGASAASAPSRVSAIDLFLLFLRPKKLGMVEKCL